MTETKLNQTPPEVVRVSVDDWEGVYLDGKLVAENHSLRASDILRIFAKLGLITYMAREGDSEWLEEEGRLPELLAEVKFKLTIDDKPNE